MPTAATAQMPAAVVSPRTVPPSFRIMPPPRKPTPVRTFAATRPGASPEIWPNTSKERAVKSAEPMATRLNVRSPAGLPMSSRSRPTTNPSRPANKTLPNNSNSAAPDRTHHRGHAEGEKEGGRYPAQPLHRNDGGEPASGEDSEAVGGQHAERGSRGDHRCGVEAGAKRHRCELGFVTHLSQKEDDGCGQQRAPLAAAGLGRAVF